MKVLRFLPMLLSLGACTTGEQISGLQEGMTRQQVESKLGRPDGFQRDGQLVRYQYTDRMISGWGWDRADYYAVFNDDRLVQWGTGNVREKTGPAAGTVFVVPTQ